MAENLILNNKNNVFKYIFVRNKKKFLLKYENQLDNNYKLFSCDLLNDKIFNLLLEIDPIDSFCYFPGMPFMQLVKHAKRDVLMDVFEINYFKPYFITQFLLKKKKLNFNSNVLYVSSISGIDKVANGISGYSNSKAALNNLVKVLTLESKKLKIKFNTICPAVIQTDFINEINSISKVKHDDYPLGIGNPKDLNSIIDFFLFNNTWITGQNIVADGGMSIK